MRFWDNMEEEEYDDARAARPGTSTTTREQRRQSDTDSSVGPGVDDGDDTLAMEKARRWSKNTAAANVVEQKV
jgi:hypothetical protein